MTVPITATMPNAIRTTMAAEGIRPSPQRRKRITSGANMNVTKIANANGMNIVRAKYSTATTISTISNVWFFRFPLLRFPFGTG